VGEPGSDGDLRALPSVDRVMAALGSGWSHQALAAAARAAVDAARDEARAGSPISMDAIVQRAEELLRERARTELQSVFNATGVLIHTNLGRVPLGRRQLDAIVAVASSYSNLEYDVGRGVRGTRYAHARRALIELTGAESALVVNNCAAALVLCLAALCREREVLVSRGELIEIGGEFRIPEILEASGARLSEVGTTNRTRLVDFERAISDNTAAILKVHPSNYRVVGFTQSVSSRDLARLARGRGVLFIYDLGSGLIDPRAEAPWLQGEPDVRAAVAEQADLLSFSGDKLLGGPQAGIILGRADLIERLKRHPLMRALRVDKLTLAALQATLEAHLEGRASDLPVWAMALADAASLEGRARQLEHALTEALEDGVTVEARPTASVSGGGSSPGTDFESWGVSLSHSHHRATVIEGRLRRGTPPVIGRIEDDHVLLDLRAIAPEDDERLAAAVTAALSG
jgi:L-seryl-tRNA(Ser) seleniumtransferase